MIREHETSYYYRRWFFLCNWEYIIRILFETRALIKFSRNFYDIARIFFDLFLRFARCNTYYTYVNDSYLWKLLQVSSHTLHPLKLFIHEFYSHWIIQSLNRKLTIKRVVICERYASHFCFANKMIVHQ